MTDPILLLEMQRLRSSVVRLWTNRQQMRRAAWFVLFFGFYLWFNIFRHVAAHQARFLEQWHFIRYAFPLLLTLLAAMLGSFDRMNRLLARWSSGSWSVLPVEPRSIAQSLLGSMFLMDSVWVAVALVISIGLSFVSGLVWWKEFPFLLLGTVLLIAAASIAKTFSTLVLRLGSARMLQWQNWILKWLGALLTMLFVQPLVGFWLLAEYARQNDVLSMTVAALVVIALSVAALVLLARHLLVRKWSAIAASFEIQQTQHRAKETVPLATFIADRMRSPVTRFVTLDNLRAGIQMSSWGQARNIGGRRLYMMIAFLVAISALLALTALATHEENAPVLMVVFFGSWSALILNVMLQPVFPVYRLLRQMPVTFGAWLRAISALPLAITGTMLLASGVLIVSVEPSAALRSCAILLGIYAGVVPVRLLVVSAFPDAQQTTEFVYMGVVGAGGLLVYTVSWVAAVPLVLAADIYLFRRASHMWRYREEGLHV
ncbi:MAG TPA: hypothetical protein VGL38_00475 [bacterium]|jgi:hypothetical protein